LCTIFDTYARMPPLCFPRGDLQMFACPPFPLGAFSLLRGFFPFACIFFRKIVPPPSFPLAIYRSGFWWFSPCWAKFLFPISPFCSPSEFCFFFLPGNSNFPLPQKIVNPEFKSFFLLEVISEKNSEDSSSWDSFFFFFSPPFRKKRAAPDRAFLFSIVCLSFLLDEGGKTLLP